MAIYFKEIVMTKEKCTKNLTKKNQSNFLFILFSFFPDFHMSAIYPWQTQKKTAFSFFPQILVFFLLLLSLCMWFDLTYVNIHIYIYIFIHILFFSSSRTIDACNNFHS